VRLVDSGWETELSDGLAMCEGRLLVTCPFIKHSVVVRLLNQTSLNELLVVTRFNLADFARGVSDIAALQTLMEAGAQVRGLRGLHAKVFVFGNRRAAVTSANLTESALKGNIEIGCISDDKAFVASCAKRVRELHARGVSATADELADWDESVKGCLRHAGRDDPIASLPDHGAPPAEPHEPPPVPAPGVSTGRDGWVAESRQAFIKFAGLGHERAPLTDAVLGEISGSGAFKFGAYPAGQGHPWRVEDGATIFMSRITSDPNDMRIVGRAIAIAHDPEHDMATAGEIKRRDWLTQWPYLVRVHDPQFIDGTLGDGVALSALMDELGPVCFRSTKRRVRAGEQNVNPRRSVRQKADVELSDEGFAWMTERFESALANHGAIPSEQLRRLR
jgi:hypothetical protein